MSSIVVNLLPVRDNNFQMLSGQKLYIRNKWEPWTPPKVQGSRREARHPNEPQPAPRPRGRGRGLPTLPFSSCRWTSTPTRSATGRRSSSGRSHAGWKRGTRFPRLGGTCPPDARWARCPQPRRRLRRSCWCGRSGRWSYGRT